MLNLPLPTEAPLMRGYVHGSLGPATGRENPENSATHLRRESGGDERPATPDRSAAKASGREAHLIGLTRVLITRIRVRRVEIRVLII